MGNEHGILDLIHDISTDSLDREDLPVLIDEWLRDFGDCAIMIAAFNMHVALQPHDGALAVLSETSTEEALRLSAKDRRALVRWVHLCACFWINSAMWP